MKTAKKIVRACSVCGDGIKINVDAKGHYDAGHYFGRLNAEKKRKTIAAEYWECNLCYGQAQREGWLEGAIEKYYGERCKDFEASCITCDVWSLYNKITKDDRLRGNFRQTYDKRADAAYIYVKDKIRRGESARTLELSDFVNLDFGKKRNLLGIEVLGIRHMPKAFALPAQNNKNSPLGAIC